MNDTVPSQEIIQKHTKETKVSLVNVCRLYDKKKVFQHAQSCFTMSFWRSFWWDLARASSCRFQPKKRNGGPLATSNLWKITTKISGQRTCFNSSGETDRFLPGKHRFLGCLGKNQETSCKKVPNFPIKHFEASDYSTREPWTVFQRFFY